MLESDYPAGEEVPQDLEASQGDRVSLAGSVASVGSTGSDGALAAEGTTAIPQTASSGFTDQPAEHSGIPGSGSSLLRNALIECPYLFYGHTNLALFSIAFLTV